MLRTSRRETHESLMNRLAASNGADLDQLMQEGTFSPEDFEAAVTACTGCTDPGGCEARLDEGGPGIPEFCRNFNLMERLSQRSSP